MLGLCSLALATTASITSADADILTLRGDAKLGAAGGKGMFGARKDESFHQGRGALAYGAVVGAEVFFIDLWVQHDQFVKGGSVSGTWTQFMLGVDAEIDLGEQVAFERGEGGNKKGGYSAWFVEIGMGAGFGVGTGQQVDPPLDNGEVTDKGFLFEARAMAGRRLTSILSVGVTAPVQFGYFTKSGSGAVANDTDQHYSSIGGTLMLTLRANWNLK